MSQDELIQHIQVKHGVTLGKDDPILMLQTMLDGFSRELEQKQAALLSDTKHQIEDMLVRSEAKTKELAERLINIAIEEGERQFKLNQENLLVVIDAKLQSTNSEKYTNDQYPSLTWQIITLCIITTLSVSIIMKYLF